MRRFERRVATRHARVLRARREDRRARRRRAAATTRLARTSRCTSRRAPSPPSPCRQRRCRGRAHRAGAARSPPRKAAESGKPANIVEKMVEGPRRQVPGRSHAARRSRSSRIDGKETVEQLLKAKGATVNGFTLFVVGEGIEKKKDDFAAEVATMTRPPRPGETGRWPRCEADTGRCRTRRAESTLPEIAHEPAERCNARRRSECREPAATRRPRTGASCSSSPARR